MCTLMPLCGAVHASNSKQRRVRSSLVGHASTKRTCVSAPAAAERVCVKHAPEKLVSLVEFSKLMRRE